MHPHNPLCAKGELEVGGFDSLIVDYSPSVLTITWLHTFSPVFLRHGGFADSELGARMNRDREYWVKMQEHIITLVRSIDEARRQDEHGHSPLKFSLYNQLIFLGESGADELLRSFLREALRGTRFDLDTVTIHDSYGPVFASSVGGAVIEKAMMDAPMPRQCELPTECEEQRERIFQEALQGDTSTLEL